MSTRPNWFRAVVAIFVLTFVSLTVQIYSQDLKISNSDSDPVEKGLVEELFPYAMKSVGPESADLITAGTYAFLAQTSIGLEDMSAGTTQLVGGALDDNASPVTNIGFDFWYDGVRHSQFSVNANGLARLGSTVATGSFNNTTEGLNTTVNAPKIAAYHED